jgi:hypothetical protein
MTHFVDGPVTTTVENRLHSAKVEQARMLGFISFSHQVFEKLSQTVTEMLQNW